MLYESCRIHVNILLHAACFMSKTLEIFHWFLNKLQWSKSYQNVFQISCRSLEVLSLRKDPAFFPARALFWFHIWYWPYLMKKLYGAYHMAHMVWFIPYEMVNNFEINGSIIRTETYYKKCYVLSIVSNIKNAICNYI